MLEILNLFTNLTYLTVVKASLFTPYLLQVTDVFYSLKFYFHSLIFQL